MGEPSFVIAGPSPVLRGDVTVPGDKSVGHRAVLFAGLATGRSRVRGLSGGEDNLRTVAALRTLGLRVDNAPDGGLFIDGAGFDGLRAPSTPIDCGNSGTTMRLLCGVLASRPFVSRLVGDQYLEARPMARVAKPLGMMGATLRGRSDAKGNLCAPLDIGPLVGKLRGIEWTSPQASAQVKTAILLAGLCADGKTRVHEPHASRDHTERMLAAQGAPITRLDDGAEVDPAGWNGRLAPLDVVVPGDLSSAAFLLGAAAIVPGSRVVVRGVGINPTRTGVLDALRAMGAQISVENARDVGGEPVADLVASAGPLVGTTIAGALAVRAIDELPLLAMVAAHADGETVIADAAELRVKESDRIAATVAALRALGMEADERPDGMVVAGRAGRRTATGVVDSHGDHRIAMAAAVAALATDRGARVDGTANVATSFPGFAALLRRLGAPLDETTT